MALEILARRLPTLLTLHQVAAFDHVMRIQQTHNWLTEPVPGILMVGGKEIGGGPVETFPAETCAGKVQH